MDGWSGRIAYESAIIKILCWRMSIATNACTSLPGVARLYDGSCFWPGSGQL